MASSKNPDYSVEIIDFRRSLSAALSRRIADLEYEIGRVKRLSLKLPEKPAIKVVGKIDLTQFDPKKGKKRERIKSGRIAIVKDNPSTQDGNGNEACGVARPDTSAGDDKLFLRRCMLEFFIAEASAFVDFVRNISLLCSTLQFAVIRKEITTLNSDSSIITPYTGWIPTLNELSSFLISSYQLDDQLTREYLTRLSGQHNSLLVLSAVCDNLKASNCNAKEAESSITSAILSLGCEQVSFSKELGAYMVAIENCRLRNFEYYLSTAQKLDRKSVSGDVFPLDDITGSELDWNYDAEEEYQSELNGVLDYLKEKELFTHDEFNAIDGLEELVLSGGRIQQRSNQNQSMEQDKVNGSPIECPKVFKKNPEALRRFYRSLVEDEYISVDEDSFLYWFNSLNIEKDKVNRITWKKNLTDLKCFLEALYPRHNNYKKFISVFVDPNGLDFKNIGGNALIYRAVKYDGISRSSLPYDGRRGQVAYDSQKSFIETIEGLIKKAVNGQ